MVPGTIFRLDHTHDLEPLRNWLRVGLHAHARRLWHDRDRRGVLVLGGGHDTAEPQLLEAIGDQRGGGLAGVPVAALVGRGCPVEADLRTKPTGVTAIFDPGITPNRADQHRSDQHRDRRSGARPRAHRTGAGSARQATYTPRPSSAATRREPPPALARRPRRRPRSAPAPAAVRCQAAGRSPKTSYRSTARRSAHPKPRLPLLPSRAEPRVQRHPQVGDQVTRSAWSRDPGPGRDR